MTRGWAGRTPTMPKDRDQMTPAEPEDAERLESTRGQGRAGTGGDILPEDPPGPGAASGDSPPSRD